MDGSQHASPSHSPLLALLQDEQNAKLIKQGAEAKVYKITSLFDATPDSYTPAPVLLKYRFSKSYRHATLDSSLTRSRISHEAKCLARCKKAGVDVPSVRGVDLNAGILLLEWIDGHGSVREVLGGLPEEVQDDEDEQETEEADVVRERLQKLNLSEDVIMTSIGRAIGKMHSSDVIHGDLTTSNMLLRGDTPASIVLIDFGLSYISTLVEDKAVDLYVLERALASTHPEPEDRPKSERHIEKILQAYAEQVGAKEWSRVERRLKDGALPFSAQAFDAERLVQCAFGAGNEAWSANPEPKHVLNAVFFYQDTNGSGPAVCMALMP